MNLFRRNPKKNTQGDLEPLDINWFNLVLLAVGLLFLLALLYVLVLEPLLFDGDPEFEIVPYGGEEATATATPPPSFTPAPTLSPAPTVIVPPSATPAPALPVTASTAAYLVEIAALNDVSAEISSVAFSPDGGTLAAASYNGAVRVWDVETWAQGPQFQSSSNRVNSLAFSPDGTQLVAGGQDTVVRVWDLRSQAETRLDGPSQAVRSVAYSPDGRWIAAGSDDGVIYLWNAADSPPTLARLLNGHTSYVTSVAFSPDSDTVAAGGEDDTIRLWNVETGAAGSILRGHTSTVTDIAFSPDGTRLASSGADQTVRLWSLLTESQEAVMQGHSENVNAVAFSPDGSLVVSAGGGIEDNTARFWDARTGEPERVPLGFVGPLNSVTFSPGGLLMAAGGATYLSLWGVTGLDTLGGPAAQPSPVPSSIFSTPLPTEVPTQTPAFPTNVPTTAPQQGGSAACTLTVRSLRANQRTGPGTNYDIAGQLTQNETVQANGWATGADSYTWWRLANNTWVRGDAFISASFPAVPDACLQLPPVGDVPAAPAATAVPTPVPAQQAGSTAICTLTVRDAQAEERTGPGTGFELAGTLTQGQTAQATGWITGEDSYTWWRLANNTWVRGDAFISPAYPSLPDACLQLAPVSAEAVPQSNTGSAGTCLLTVRRSQATTYSGPGETYPAAGSVVQGQTAQPTGWTTGDDGFTWWQLGDGSWARGDVFLDASNPAVPDACFSLPVATP